MGANPSKYDNVKIEAQKPHVAAVDERYILSQPTTLAMRDNMFATTKDIEIKDANSSKPYFVIKGRGMSLKEKKTLWDTRGVPVLNIKKQLLGFVPNHSVFRANNSEYKLFDIRAHFNVGKPQLSITFINIVSGETCIIGCKGDWQQRNVVFWIERGVELKPKDYAKLHSRPGTPTPNRPGTPGSGKQKKISNENASAKSISGSQTAVNMPSLESLNGAGVKQEKTDSQRQYIARIAEPYIDTNWQTTSKADYWLTVAPGVDMALMVAICVVLDERSHD
ncbi:hypothetical protein HDU85_003981 [Gaertneriomyces sp. JEL0708]|nr:hypothetical protein HDU85_003981 [Gaertneriomyces sp. JEL0708]